jgi:cobalt-zinc-cadmium efflux system outer membrane protein
MTLLLLLLAPVCAGAQGASQDTLRLSLADVLTRVRAEHPLVRAGAAQVAAAVANAAQRRRYPNPTLEFDRTTLREVDNVRLMQPIRWPREGAALRGLGAAEVATARAEADGLLRDAALDVAQRFVDGVRRVRALALAAEDESLAQRTVDRAVAARQLGQTGDLSVLQGQVSLDAARRGRIGAEAEHRAAAQTLALVLGLDPAAPLAFQGDLAALAPLAAPESALVRALAGDPEAGRLAGAAARAGQEGRLARARRWPEIELGPAAGLGKTSTFGLALGLSLPLWNRQGDAVRAAEAIRAAALARLDFRRREVAALVTEATSTLTRAAQELDLLRSGELARAKQAESLAARALEQGGPYLTAWLTARQAYLDARRAELDLEWEAARARVTLRSLAGTLIAEEMR